MSTISESHAVRLQTSGHTNDLVAHTDTENRFVPFLQCLSEFESRIHAMPRVTRTVGQEKAVVLITNGVKIEVPREYSHRSVATNERTENVRLGTKVKYSDSDITVGVEVVRNLCGNLVNKVLGRRIPVLFRRWRRGRSVSTNCKTAEGCSLIAQQTRNLAGVYTGDSRDIEAATPGSEGFDCSVMRKFLRDVCNHDRAALNSFGLHHDSNILRVNGSLIVGDSIVSYERSGKDKDLVPIGRVSH